ncbi:MAG TPA: carbamoyl-phosphate synthase large subunit [Lachnospiraceae bacterium]|nr:carbamoyl-phosphate synthase large subunit [Lachnospiraceae bacterium]
MPKRTDIHKILVIGSGPIIIGQAAEFDYAGTQACLALKEEGYEVILCNSNPATIMTDKSVADRVYMEPLNLEYVARIIRRERPDAILPGIGGQTGLNLAMQLEKKGILAECRCELLGTDSASIEMAEDREEFKALCERLGEPVLPSVVVRSMEEGLAAAREIGYPVVLRPAFTLGGTGGGFADSQTELWDLLKAGLDLSPVGEVLVEKSVKGYKEIEYEVIRDANDTAITVCNMENLDPVGIHTGDSIVVCPSQTLTDREYHMLRDSALKIIRALRVEGGCNVQFALDPKSFRYYLIEVNPRVSRSSALASKASGYPIARVSAKISVGLTLDEIPLANTPACFEPALDYIVTKMPRFPFDKFTDADQNLGTQMKATGETMSVGRCFEESLLKAVRSLEIGAVHLHLEKYGGAPEETLWEYILNGSGDRIYAVAELMRRNFCHETAASRIEEITLQTGIDRFFLDKIANIIEEESVLKSHKYDCNILREAKRMGFSDAAIAGFWGVPEEEIFEIRRNKGIFPVYKMIDTCASEFESYVPYFYSTYEGGSCDLYVGAEREDCLRKGAYPGGENESVISDRPKIIVLGAGPIRIGQGVEFDYSTVHAVQTIRNAGYEAIVINNNPETVSTDYTTSDKLYFEPLCVEDVMNIIELEKPDGVIATLGGQTAVNLAEPLARRGVKLIGTDCEAIRRAEDRDCFEKLLKDLDIPEPKGCAVTDIEEGVLAAASIGYPVLVRPSFVLGGRAMQIVSKEKDLRHYLRTAVEIDEDKPVLVDRYISGKELEVDAICDGTDVFIPGIMELVERTGIHSGDSISVYPTFSVSRKVQDTIRDYTRRLGLGIGIKGLFNIQFIVNQNEEVYIIEVNPRSSRTVPFLSKATGYPLPDIATRVSLGISLREQGIVSPGYGPVQAGMAPSQSAEIGKDPFEKAECIPGYDTTGRSFEPDITGVRSETNEKWFVKVPVFSFSKLSGMDACLSPEMKSTGEAIGYDKRLHRAMYKALVAAGINIQNYGTVIFTLADEDKEEALPLAKRFYDLGFNLEATTMTAEHMREHGVRVRLRRKLSEGSTEILDSIRAGYVSYVVNTRAILSGVHYEDGVAIRKCASEYRVTMFTSLDTVRVLLDVLEEMTIGVSPL